MASSQEEATKTGFAASTSYDLYRPSYPEAAVENLLRALNITDMHGARVLDLGAGTGKFTQMLVDRDEAFEVVAVEPHTDMRAELVRKALPRVTVVEGTAEKMDVEDQWADAVIVAQAFHWFATEEALNSIYPVLKPKGSLGLIWNIEDYNGPKAWKPATSWEAKLKEINWSLDDGHPRFRHEKWREVFDQQLSSTPFTIQSADPLFSLPLGEDSVDFEHWLAPEQIWERFRTLSHLSVLEGPDFDSLKKRVFEAMSGPDATKNDSGELALHGKTVWAFTAAIPGVPPKNFG